MSPTHDDLRNAMNDLARGTDPLEPGPILRSGRRRRAQRRVIAAAGVAVAVVAMTGGIIALRPGGNDSIVAGGGQAIQDLDNSLQGLSSGRYAFTRTGAYLQTDITRAEIDVAEGYVVEYRNKMSVMRVGKATYLKPSGEGTYSSPGVLDQIKSAGLSQSEVDRYAAAIAQLDGTRWLRTDPQRLAEVAAVEEQSSLDYTAPVPTADKPDITGADALISAVTSADRTGDTITGTLDASKVDPEQRLIIDEPATFYGPSATAMNYRATLDGQGRLASFTLNLPSTLASQAPDSQPEPPLVITVTRYDGVKTPPAPPNAENVTALTYDLLARDND
ncbi:hypothetical protein M1L60_33920 [Actinoplanes sp. TRM 88003]|uniref:Uncharacterized protein n=1 Tax=Paractinoplanes aksuensis TaxID=2939490 RepID=A0ABT1DXK5_9ACTN|nr:hypothetical protein [Actinoplanes aksuensis]MCO8275594.1 hypothetical protein [Actinoplanes aksuensis]